LNRFRAVRNAALASILYAVIAVPALAAPGSGVDSSTWVDHDGRPIREPKTRKISLYGYMFRQAVVEPVSHALDVPDKLLWLSTPFGVSRKREAADVNAFDEVPNSTWFTNRNHMKAVPAGQIRTGPFDGVMPEKPWTISDLKKEGYNVGFQIHDAAGRKWLIKLDRKEHPQSGSGAGTVVSRLVWAAGYNIPLYQSVTFRREDLLFETQVASTRPVAPNDPPITEADLKPILDLSARSADGRYYASASLFLPGKPAGPGDLRGRRPDDPNDRYRHRNRRELRALYVLYSWVNNWDMKDQQTLDMYGKPGEGGDHLTHYLLDMDGSLGAAAEGAKPPDYGYEMRVDFPWTLRRLLTLGFVEEPWRRAPQETGIPSVGRFESKRFHPNRWRPLEEVSPYRKLTERDGYWGAKLVASFSDAQIAAALDAAHYEDPRAPAYLLPVLIERREKIARYWFDRVAPLDFFTVDGGTLRFRDLALDLGLTGPREYEVEVDASPDGARDSASRHIASTEVPLPDAAKRLTLTLSVAGSRAKSVRVDLERTRAGGWSISRVRHA
jgi:hypothetical protein